MYFKQRVKNPTDRRDTAGLRRRAFILSPLVINAAYYCFETRYFARFIAAITNNGRREMKTDKRELLVPRRSESKNFAEDVTRLEAIQFVVILLISRDNVEFTFNSDFVRHY